MEELAASLLDNKFPFQTFFEQVAALLENPHQDLLSASNSNHHFGFVSQLNKYFIHLETTLSDKQS